MTRFLITYHGMPYPEPDVVARTRAQLRRWAEDTLGAAIVDFGAPVLIGGQMSKGQPEDTAAIDGYTIIEARDLSAARELLVGHPYLDLGATLQINECQPV